MSKRFAYGCKFPVYTVGFERELLPIFRAEVTPGESIDMTAIGELNMATLASNFASKFKYHWAVYYVPHRLTDDRWVDFLTDAESVATPTVVAATDANGAFFDSIGVTVNTTYRNAYQMVFNEYYRHPDTAPKVLAPENMTTFNVDRHGLLDYDWSQEEGANDEFLAPVVGTDAQIDLNEFRNSMAAAAEGRASRSSGDKYIDVLSRFGVDLSWAVAQRPELLCSGVWSQANQPLNSTTGATGEFGLRTKAQQTRAKVVRQKEVCGTWYDHRSGISRRPSVQPQQGHDL